MELCLPPIVIMLCSFIDAITSVDMLGCNFAIDNSTVQVNAQNREVAKYMTASSPVALHNWTDPGVSSDPLLMQVRAIIVDLITKAFANIARADPCVLRNVRPIKCPRFRGTFNFYRLHQPVYIKCHHYARCVSCAQSKSSLILYVFLAAASCCQI